MSEEKNPMSADHLTACLSRLRSKMTYIQDSMDVTAFAIKAIERDLQSIQEEDSKANETDA
jgi:hypothetical protein